MIRSVWPGTSSDPRRILLISCAWNGIDVRDDLRRGELRAHAVGLGQAGDGEDRVGGGLAPSDWLVRVQLEQAELALDVLRRRAARRRPSARRPSAGTPRWRARPRSTARPCRRPAASPGRSRRRRRRTRAAWSRCRRTPASRTPGSGSSGDDLLDRLAHDRLDVGGRGSARWSGGSGGGAGAAPASAPPGRRARRQRQVRGRGSVGGHGTAAGDGRRRPRPAAGSCAGSVLADAGLAPAALHAARRACG